MKTGDNSEIAFRRRSRTELPWPVHERICALLQERSRASTDELIEHALGKTSGSRVLAGRIVEQYLLNHPDLFQYIAGKWQLAELPAHRPDELSQSAPMDLCFLLIDRIGRSGPFSLGMVRPGRNEAPDWLVLADASSKGKRIFQVLSGKEERERAALDQPEAIHMADRFARGATLWYLGRSADLQRLRDLWLPSSETDPIPFWPVARRLWGLPAVKRPDALAQALALPEYPEDPDSPAERLCWWMRALQKVHARLFEEGVRGHQAILDWLLRESAPAEDFSGCAFDRSDLWAIPESPGIYCFRDRRGALLYVGKSKNLRRRVLSYFQSGASNRIRKRFLLTKIHSFEYHSLGSDLEALVSESRLIQELEPDFNVQQSVRAPRTGYFTHSPAIAVFPNPDRESVLDLWCICPGRRAKQLAFKVSVEGIRRIRKELTRIFGKPAPRGKADWDGESLLVAAWLHRNRQSANWIDVEKAGNVDELIRQLCAYASAAEELGNQRIIIR